MKKILTILLLVFSVQIYAQENLITGININLPSFPDANTSKWGSGTNVFTITASCKVVGGRIDDKAARSKILVTIQKSGSKICGSYTSLTAPASNFKSATTVWSGRNAAALLGQDCILDPGEYVICVQFFWLENVVISEKKCRPFSIKAEDLPTYQSPQLISPTDGSVISGPDAKKPVTFRWTPVVPKPRGEVVYKLRIIEIRQGQTATAAAKTTNPLLEKEVINQYQLTGIFLSQIPIADASQYGWYVQGTNREGIPFGENEGTSNINMLRVSESTCKHIATISSIECLGMVEGFQAYEICVDYTNTALAGCSNCDILLSHLNNYPGIDGGGVTIVSTNQTTTIMSILQPVPEILHAGGQTTICFEAFTTGTNLQFMVHATCNDELLTLPEGDRNHENSIFDTLPPPCLCTDCDSLDWTFNLNAIKISETQYDLTGTVGVNLDIYGIEFQVQSYSYTPTPLPCSNGITCLEESGMLLLPQTTINGTSTIQVFNENISGSGSTNNNATKTVKLTSSSQLPNPVPVNLSIGLPGVLSGLPPDCCTIEYEVCIKVTVFYDEETCKSCTYTECFSFNNL